MRLRLKIRFRDGFGRDRHQLLNLQFSNKPVSATGKSFHELRALCRVAEYLADFVDGGIEVALDVDESVRPEALLQFFARDHFAGTLQQDGEHLERLPA